MGFFEETITKAKELATKTGEVAEDVIATQKLKLKHISVKNELRKNFELLGQYVYNEKENNDDNGEAISALIEVIKAQKNEINELAKEIALSKGGKLCDCGETNDGASQYCKKCGKAF